MSEYDINEAVKCAMIAVDRLCDTVGRTHFSPADPDSEFHWKNISSHVGRKPLYQKIKVWLLEDNHVSLEDKNLALTASINNLCAQLERFAWMWTPIRSMSVMVNDQRYNIAQKSPREQINGSEEVDMCMNSGYILYSAQQWLNIHNEMLNHMQTEVDAQTYKVEDSDSSSGMNDVVVENKHHPSTSMKL